VSAPKKKRRREPGGKGAEQTIPSPDSNAVVRIDAELARVAADESIPPQRKSAALETLRRARAAR
jgi:hypothetical protein